MNAETVRITAPREVFREIRVIAAEREKGNPETFGEILRLGLEAYKTQQHNDPKNS